MEITAPGMNQIDRRSASARHWTLLQYFNVYRALIAIGAVAIALFAGSLPPFGERSPELFLYTSLTFLVITLFGIEITRSRVPDCETQATVFAFSDIAFLTLLMHASGGLVSGLGLLMMLSVTGASLILGRRMTVFIAAVAAIAVILEHTWEWLRGDATVTSQMVQDFPQVGVLGIGLFAISTLAHNLSQRLQSTEALAERRGVDLMNLSHINELIIQRMQMGVLVCNKEGRISMTNARSMRFLGIPKTQNDNPPLPEIAPELFSAMREWLENPSGQLRNPFRSKSGHFLLPRFILLDTNKQGILIFLNDTALLRQQAQQLKMSALARLTASIAHEIRNPLGAISNAAQLLGESGQRDADDKRLVEIIGDHSRRMNVIIENITQLSRRDRVNQLKLALHPWLKEFLEQFLAPNDLLPEAVGFTGPENLFACVDPDQLYQVVVNLCTNALRHCPAYEPGSAPLIRLELGQRADQRPYLDVIDRGSGVPADVADNIFDPFFTTTPMGTGLGLYIARELCEGNGGGLEYINAGESGAHFRISFAKAEECSE